MRPAQGEAVIAARRHATPSAGAGLVRALTYSGQHALQVCEQLRLASEEAPPRCGEAALLVEYVAGASP